METKKQSKSLFLVIQITEKCNQRCTYCYVPKSPKTMPFSVAKKVIQFANDLIKSNIYEDVTICFHGGEPTKAFNLVKEVVSYAKQNSKINKFVTGTNGILLDTKKVKFLISNNFSLTISMDGIPKAHNLNRVYRNGKGSWKDINKVLDLLAPYQDIWRNKRIPDPLRIRITLTPDNIQFLADSIYYLVNKAIGEIAAITIMPVISSNKEWKNLLKEGQLSTILNKQMKNIAELYVKRDKEKKPFDFCINECLTPEWSNFNYPHPLGLTKIPFCGAGGSRGLGISIEGEIYPCHLPAGDPKHNKQFCMGNVSDGITRPEVVSKFCGKKQNKAFSCLYWNYIENGNPNAPALIYSVLYQSWKRALKTKNINLLR